MTDSRHKELQQRLKEGRPTWWAPSVNRQSDQTGIAHVVHDGGALCGARPFSMGGSFPSPAHAGCHECKRCRKIIDEAAAAVTGRTPG